MKMSNVPSHIETDDSGRRAIFQSKTLSIYRADGERASNYT